MKKFSEIREARGDTCVFTFGRFNPPTTGHEKLLDAVAGQAKKNPGAPYYVFASHSENAKKDPLPYSKKVAYMKKMFPKHARNIIVDKARNVFEIAVSLHNKGHKAIVMVVGSDRVAEFEGLLNKYNGVEARHGYYGFDNIEVVSAGERDPDAEGVTGMSASKMRAAASANDFEQFKLGLPRGFADGKKLFADVRKHMGIRESFNGLAYTITEEDIIRDMYVRGEVLKIGDEVTDNYSGATGKIIRRGTNYLTFAEEDGTTHKKWLYEIQLAEDCWDGYKQVGMKKKNGKDVPNCVPVGEKQDKDIKDREGTQPAKYYAKDAEGDTMAKSTKQARARHFEKGKKGPAPGDASAKTKPSKYTKKYQQMFGDKDEEFQLDEKIEGLVNKSEKSGISYSILKKVYDRGMAAYKTGHRPGATPQQWAFARVNSFITGGKTRTTADADLWKQHKGKSEEYVVERASAKRDAMRAMGRRRGVDPADIDTDASTDDVKAASKNIIMQLRKSVSMRGNHPVEFANGTYKVDAKIAQAAQDKYMRIKRPADKLAFQNKIATSYKDLLTALKEDSVIFSEEMKCPPATQDVKINTKNRDATIKQFMYGPLNIDEPGDYWKKVADKWDTSVEAAKKSLCGNCVAFDISERMKDCMPGETSDDDGELGYCWMHHFKCHSARTCTTWAKGGPITDDEKSYDWQERAGMDESEDSREIGTDAYREKRQSMTPGQKVKKFSFKEHLDCGTPNCCNECETSSLIESNVYRVGSEKYFEFFQEKRDAYKIGVYNPVGFDKELMEGDLGKYDMYQGEHVPLDCPMMFEEKDVELNKPKVGGPKKYYVYVKDPSTGNVKKVTFGDTSGLRVKLDDKEARKSFAARHDCENQKDKTKAGYWSCNLPRYAKQLGLSGGGNFFW